MRNTGSPPSDSTNTSITATMVWLVIMQARRARRDRQPSSHAGSRGGRPVPALFRRENDVAELGGDQRHAFDQEVFLAFHDQPEFREILMEVAEIVGRRGGNALLADNV